VPVNTVELVNRHLKKIKKDKKKGALKLEKDYA
jgi:hypothetical protein